MALFDDERFLLSYIHHSFITCDDTGMCEAVMLGETVLLPMDKQDLTNLTQEEKVLNYFSDITESELLESNAGHSYDVASGVGFLMGGHRHRSNTAQRLERLRKEKRAQAKIAHVQWREPSQKTLSSKELCELFPKKDLSQVKKGPIKSALSEALDMFPAVVNNPFNEFARFDGTLNRNAASKKILIYLTMLPPEERNYGMEIVCLSSARVQELIGLICWMYTSQGKEPKLQPPVSNYCLKIAEETGEVDEDFPSLDGNEYVGKFGFPCLALIEREDKISYSSINVNIQGETAKVEVPNLNVTLRDVANLASQKVSFTESKAYHMEKLHEPGIPISLDTKLGNFESFDFRLVFEQDSRDPMLRESFRTEEYDSHMRAVEAPLYRSYNVSLCQKMGMNYDVQLGISGEKVEINPLPPKGAAKLLSRPQKATTHNMDSIATCEIISKKYNPGKCTFRLVHYTGLEFKKYIFETDPQAAQDIVKKVQLILEMHSSYACKEYQVYRTKKLQKKMQKSHPMALPKQ